VVGEISAKLILLIFFADTMSTPTTIFLRVQQARTNLAKKREDLETVREMIVTTLAMNPSVDVSSHIAERTRLEREVTNADVEYLSAVSANRALYQPSSSISAAGAVEVDANGSPVRVRSSGLSTVSSRKRALETAVEDAPSAPQKRHSAVPAPTAPVFSFIYTPNSSVGLAALMQSPARSVPTPARASLFPEADEESVDSDAEYDDAAVPAPVISQPFDGSVRLPGGWVVTMGHGSSGVTVTFSHV